MTIQMNITPTDLSDKQLSYVARYYQSDPYAAMITELGIDSELGLDYLLSDAPEHTERIEIAMHIKGN